jgi:hypothetical protein
VAIGQVILLALFGREHLRGDSQKGRIVVRRDPHLQIAHREKLGNRFAPSIVRERS